MTARYFCIIVLLSICFTSTSSKQVLKIMKNGKTCRPKLPKCSKDKCCTKCSKCTQPNTCYNPFTLPGNKPDYIGFNLMTPPPILEGSGQSEPVLVYPDAANRDNGIDIILNRGCDFEGKSYKHHDLFKTDKCILCLCSNGEVTCEEVICKENLVCPPGQHLGRKNTWDCCERCLDDFLY